MSHSRIHRILLRSRRLWHEKLMGHIARFRARDPLETPPVYSPTSLSTAPIVPRKSIYFRSRLRRAQGPATLPFSLHPFSLALAPSRQTFERLYERRNRASDAIMRLAAPRSAHFQLARGSRSVARDEARRSEAPRDQFRYASRGAQSGRAGPHEVGPRREFSIGKNEVLLGRN